MKSFKQASKLTYLRVYLLWHLQGEHAGGLSGEHWRQRSAGGIICGRATNIVCHCCGAVINQRDHLYRLPHCHMQPGA